MQKIDSETSLRNAILQLESKRADEGKKVKEQFNLTLDSIRPINLIKSAFKETTASRDLKDNILSASVGLAAGYLAKIVIASVTKGPINKLIGTAIMYGITNVVAKNPETVKSLGKIFLKIFKSKIDGSVHYL